MISLLIYASNDSFSIQPLFNFQPSINLIYTVGNLNYMDTVIVIKLDFFNQYFVWFHAVFSQYLFFNYTFRQKTQ